MFVPEHTSCGVHLEDSATAKDSMLAVSIRQTMVQGGSDLDPCGVLFVVPVDTAFDDDTVDHAVADYVGRVNGRDVRVLLTGRDSGHIAVHEDAGGATGTGSLSDALDRMGGRVVDLRGPFMRDYMRSGSPDGPYDGLGLNPWLNKGADFNSLDVLHGSDGASLVSEALGDAPREPVPQEPGDEEDPFPGGPDIQRVTRTGDREVHVVQSWLLDAGRSYVIETGGTLLYEYGVSLDARVMPDDRHVLVSLTVSPSYTGCSDGVLIFGPADADYTGDGDNMPLGGLYVGDDERPPLFPSVDSIVRTGTGDVRVIVAGHDD